MVHRAPVILCMDTPGDARGIKCVPLTRSPNETAFTAAWRYFTTHHWDWRLFKAVQLPFDSTVAVLALAFLRGYLGKFPLVSYRGTNIDLEACTEDTHERILNLAESVATSRPADTHDCVIVNSRFTGALLSKEAAELITKSQSRWSSKPSGVASLATGWFGTATDLLQHARRIPEQLCAHGKGVLRHGTKSDYVYLPHTDSTSAAVIAAVIHSMTGHWPRVAQFNDLLGSRATPTLELVSVSDPNEFDAFGTCFGRRLYRPR